MQVTARLNNLRIAPRKVRLVAHSIVGLPVQTALVRLKQEVQRSAEPMKVLLESAIANATNNFKLAKEHLFIAEVRVLDGVRLKRFTPKAFGSATPILKRTSKIHMILDERQPKRNAALQQSAKSAKAKQATKKVSTITPESITTT